MSRDESWMRRALELAARAQAEGEVPVGALVVREDPCWAKAGIDRSRPMIRPPMPRSLRFAMPRPLAGDYRLGGATLYVTLEPCPMCAAAMAHARIARLVFGAWDPRQGAAGSAFNLVTATPK